MLVGLDVNGRDRSVCPFWIGITFPFQVGISPFSSISVTIFKVFKKKILYFAKSKPQSAKDKQSVNKSLFKFTVNILHNFNSCICLNE